MLTSVILWADLLRAQVESPTPAPPASVAAGLDLATLLAPILSTGVVGALFLMLLFRVKIMPTYVFDRAEKAWADERARVDAAHNGEIARLHTDIGELKEALKDANGVYTQQVIPTLTRVLDAERELVDLRRDEAVERRRRGSPD